MREMVGNDRRLAPRPQMSHAVKGLGAAEVTMLVRGSRLLERMEPFAGELVAAGLAEATWGLTGSAAREPGHDVRAVEYDIGSITGAHARCLILANH
jgi:hypothetical protein